MSDRPSDLVILLTMALDERPDLVADEIRGRLATLGFGCSTQQVAAWLGRMSREECPCVERFERWGFLKYHRLTRFGWTLLGNRLPVLRVVERARPENAQRTAAVAAVVANRAALGSEDSHD